MPKNDRRHRDRRTSQKPDLGSNRRETPRRSDEERRAQTRVPIDLWMEEVRGDEVYFRRSCNLSEGGVLFEQSIPYPVGTKVQLRFTLPGGTNQQTEAEVVSAAQAGVGLGMGLRFVSLPDSVQKAIAAYLKAVVAKRKSK